MQEDSDGRDELEAVLTFRRKMLPHPFFQLDVGSQTPITTAEILLEKVQPTPDISRRMKQFLPAFHCHLRETVDDIFVILPFKPLKRSDIR